MEKVFLLVKWYDCFGDHYYVTAVFPTKEAAVAYATEQKYVLDPKEDCDGCLDMEGSHSILEFDVITGEQS